MEFIAAIQKLKAFSLIVEGKEAKIFQHASSHPAFCSEMVNALEGN